MRRTKEEAALTRQSILRSSLAVFSTKGYAAARLEDVARLAGVTRGAVYWHFRGKPGLYQALLEAYSARAAQVVQAAIDEGGSFADVVRRLFSRLLTAVEEDRGLQAVLELGLFKTEDAAELRSVRRRQQQAADDLLHGLAEVIRQAAAQGDIRPETEADPAARALLALQNGLIQQWLLSPRSFSLREVAPTVADIFLRGIERR
jgi:TetR/AcrR family acrAB operon transcriptional repressor